MTAPTRRPAISAEVLPLHAVALVVEEAVLRHVVASVEDPVPLLATSAEDPTTLPATARRKL